MQYYNEDKVFKYFEKIINDSLAKKTAELKKLISEIKDKKLQTVKEKIMENYESILDTKLKEITLTYKSEINKIVFEKNRKLVEKRKKLFTELFSEVEAKLLDFVHSDEYNKLMKRKLESLNNIFSTPIKFLVSENDTKIKNLINSSYNGKYEIENNEKINIGGFIARSQEQGIEIDETLDNKLNEKKRWFYANSKLYIRS